MTQNDSFKPEKVMMSGASGMLGSALRETLRGSGAEVIQLVRREPAHSGEMHWKGKGQQTVRLAWAYSEVQTHEIEFMRLLALG